MRDGRAYLDDEGVPFEVEDARLRAAQRQVEQDMEYEAQLEDREIPVMHRDGQPPESEEGLLVIATNVKPRMGDHKITQALIDLFKPTRIAHRPINQQTGAVRW